MKPSIHIAIGLLITVPGVRRQKRALHLDAVDPHKTERRVLLCPAANSSSPAGIVSVDMKIFNPGNLAKYAIVYFPETYRTMAIRRRSRSHAQDVTSVSRRPDPDLGSGQDEGRVFRGPGRSPQMTRRSRRAHRSQIHPDFLYGQ